MQISNRISTHPNHYVSLPTGTALVPYTKSTGLVPLNSKTSTEIDPFHSLTGDATNLLFSRNASPSELSEVSLDLYAMGLVSFDDYSALANHPEIHPGFDRTIGALTGEPAAPDRKRDLVEEWEDKYQFLNRYSPDNKNLIEQAERITKLLSALSRKTNLRV